jgi:hypothetical protein
MMYDSPSPEWYEPDDEITHDCVGVWCTDSSHREEDECQRR